MYALTDMNQRDYAQRYQLQLQTTVSGRFSHRKTDIRFPYLLHGSMR
ncbi:MAG: hypothetical protein PHW79_11870 [Candidatus Marinimicrobia bacterium]|nr:hypothetical protein [Candidatus Neomarinimicrobiota bacterium]